MTARLRVIRRIITTGSPPSSLPREAPQNDKKPTASSKKEKDTEGQKRQDVRPDRDSFFSR